MSDLYIETEKGRLYIRGDNAVEMIVPPGFKPENDPAFAESLPVTFDINWDGDEVVVEEISKSIELRLKSGTQLTEER